MKYKNRIIGNWVIILLMTLFFGGVLVLGISQGQAGETLFNATLV